MSIEVLLYVIAERRLHFCGLKIASPLPMKETIPQSIVLIGYSLNLLALLISERSVVLLQAEAKNFLSILVCRLIYRALCLPVQNNAIQDFLQKFAMAPKLSKSHSLK